MFMIAASLPPTRTSRVTLSSGTSTASVPNQTAKCSGLVQTSHTSSGGAARVRVMVKLSVILFLLVAGW